MLNTLDRQTGAITALLFFLTPVRPIDYELVSPVLTAQQLLVYCMYQRMRSPPGVRPPPPPPPPPIRALVCCCCYVIYILFMAFSIGMLILIYMAHSWIGTLFEKLRDSLGKGFPHSLALYPLSTPPPCPFHPSSPPNTEFLFRMEKEEGDRRIKAHYSTGLRAAVGLCLKERPEIL